MDWLTRLFDLSRAREVSSASRAAVRSGRKKESDFEPRTPATLEKILGQAKEEGDTKFTGTHLPAICDSDPGLDSATRTNRLISTSLSSVRKTHPRIDFKKIRRREKRYRGWGRQFPVDRLPPELRNTIYDLVLPEDDVHNLRRIRVPPICQLTRLCRQEALPLFMSRNTWIWTCISNQHMPLRLATIGTPWRLNQDTRLYLQIPDHLLVGLESITIIGATNSKPALFAFELSVAPRYTPPTGPGNITGSVGPELEVAFRMKDLLPRPKRVWTAASSSPPPKLTPRILNTQRGKKFAKDLTSALNRAMNRPTRLRFSGPACFTACDLYTVWEHVHRFTNGIWFGAHGRGDPVEMSGLFDGAALARKRVRDALAEPDDHDDDVYQRELGTRWGPDRWAQLRFLMNVEWHRELK